MSLVLATLALLSASPAHAVIYGGNPELTIKVQRPQDDLTGGTVTLETVVLHLCAGGAAMWNVDTQIDPVVGFSMDIPAGNFCEVELVWGDTMELDGDGAYGTFALEYDESATWITLVGATQSVELDPVTWTSGVVHGGNPELDLTIQ